MTPVTKEHLLSIMPRLKSALADSYLPHLLAAMKEADITSPLRVSAFLAQIAHESGQFRYWEELASGKAYEGRSDLGNTHEGDGPRYKGRGPIQVTGRTNYQNAGGALGLDLEAHPELAATPEVGFRIAGWFWTTHGLNELADKKDFDRITRRINGGLNGKADRDAYYQKALTVLGAV
jgi:putative chitinase